MGPSGIRWELERAGAVPLPGRSTVYRPLIRHGLVDPEKRKRRQEDYRRWERGRAMDLWQMDVMGRVHLADGVEVKVVTSIDDHSRFVVCAKAVMRAAARPVCLALAEALRGHGVPEQILTDIQEVFTARLGRGSGPVLFDRICAGNGIRHLLTKPYSPTTTGKVERLQCATRRAVVSPVQPGGTRREVPGSDGLSIAERLTETRACQLTRGRAQMSGTVLWGTRITGCLRKPAA